MLMPFSYCARLITCVCALRLLCIEQNDATTAAAAAAAADDDDDDDGDDEDEMCTGYYHCLRRLTESRLPSCIEQSDTATPPSALADTVLMLMTRPLTLDANITSSFL